MRFEHVCVTTSLDVNDLCLASLFHSFTGLRGYRLQHEIFCVLGNALSRSLDLGMDLQSRFKDE